eukprot:3854131-Prymnesium_polylepis.1
MAPASRAAIRLSLFAHARWRIASAAAIRTSSPSRRRSSVAASTAPAARSGSVCAWTCANLPMARAYSAFSATGAARSRATQPTQSSSSGPAPTRSAPL